ncbi:MAG: pseudouridine synthase [Lachnospiraceae bacterium]|nr:pseudouridine synthase [Lachnospiraceae bacterium]
MMENNKNTFLRINKILAEAGICSRREADRRIAEGRVTVNGEPAVPGMKARAEDVIAVDGTVIRADALYGTKERVVLAVNKPVGVVCTSDTRWGDETLEDLVHYPVRLFSVGRLDKASEGLILMTNDGELCNRILRGEGGHEKEYMVTLDRPVTNDFIKQMAAGVYLEELGVTTRPCSVEKAGRYVIRIILTQGLNRQIRRMCLALGYRVRKLKRIRVMSIKLNDLKEGSWRQLTGEEMASLLTQTGTRT